MRGAWSQTGTVELQTSASVKDIQRSYSLGMCASLDSTMIQCNTAPASLNHYGEAEDNIPLILKERAAARGWRLTPTRAPSRGDGHMFDSWLKNR